MSNEKNFSLKPTDGSRANAIARITKGGVWVFWISGFIIGIVAGRSMGRMQGLFSYSSYGRSSGSDFSWGTALLIWYFTFCLGIWQYAFAEIISLLQKISTTGYNAEFTGINEAIPNNSVAQPTALAQAEDKVVAEYDLLTKEQAVPFKINKLRIYKTSRDASWRLIAESRQSLQLKGVLADIQIKTIFQEEYRLENVLFMNFSASSYYGGLSDEAVCEIPRQILDTADEIFIEVRKYVIGDKLYLPGAELPTEFQREEKEAPKPVLEKPEEVVISQEKMMPASAALFCPKCGKEAEVSDAAFCSFCGARIQG